MSSQISQLPLLARLTIKPFIDSRFCLLIFWIIRLGLSNVRWLFLNVSQTNGKFISHGLLRPNGFQMLLLLVFIALMKKFHGYSIVGIRYFDTCYQLGSIANQADFQIFNFSEQLNRLLPSTDALNRSMNDIYSVFNTVELNAVSFCC